MYKTKKLKKNYEFRNALTKGKYYSGKYLDFFILENNLNINYIGIAIGVKVAKAVKRNRIKRLIYENYRYLESDLSVGYTIVVLWKKKMDIANATFSNINNDMVQVLKKIGILL